MIRDIGRTRELNLPTLIEIEFCFRIAEKYNQLLLHQLSLHSFLNQDEEIEFYKEQQPVFLSESAYYCLLNYAHSFCPTSIEDQAMFWKRQGERLLKFQQKHAEFYSYHINGQNQLDAYYYSGSLPGNYPKLKADLLARIRYAQYAEEQILKLEERLL